MSLTYITPNVRVYPFEKIDAVNFTHKEAPSWVRPLPSLIGTGWQQINDNEAYSQFRSLPPPKTKLAPPSELLRGVPLYPDQQQSGMFPNWYFGKTYAKTSDFTATSKNAITNRNYALTHDDIRYPPEQIIGEATLQETGAEKLLRMIRGM